MTDFQMPEVRPYNEHFWDAASEGTLAVQHCPDCETYVYPPRSACPGCFGDLEWTDSEGAGTVYSYTVLHHPDPPEAVSRDTPMLGCIVELDEGVRIASELVDCDPADAEIGMAVTATFEETPDGRSIPKFEPA
jgi:uncharacterized OB-fold protein